jgi:hypothetical protein
VQLVGRKNESGGGSFGGNDTSGRSQEVQSATPAGIDAGGVADDLPF